MDLLEFMFTLGIVVGEWSLVAVIILFIAVLIKEMFFGIY